MKTMKFLVAALLMLSTTLAGAQHKYELKSGIVKMSTEAAGQKTEIVQYFDDYGAKEVTETTIAMGANKMEILTVTKEGSIWIANKTTKQVQKMPANAADVVNYLSLTDEVKKKYSINELGKETILGKECTKYSTIVEQNGIKMNATVWVWKGLTLKSEASVQGMKIVQKAISIDENVTIDPAKFEIPQF